MQQEFYSHGKLLLTGEYAVLDGALSLAWPTKYGQNLTVTKIEAPLLIWKSLDTQNAVWFESTFNLNEISSFIAHSSKNSIEVTLLKILSEAKKMNPEFLKTNQGFEVVTKLTFPREWGLGSSSTLINNIAQWARVNAYQLLWNAFKGSGYDIACAQNEGPITYKLTNHIPEVNRVNFNPEFKNQLYFIYLNKKQNSRQAIANYNSIKKNKTVFIDHISKITHQILECKELEHFEELIRLHEDIISDFLGLEKIKDLLFPDYFGAVKSLGAWGGDFVLATGNQETPQYFQSKGYNTIIEYKTIILQ